MSITAEQLGRRSDDGEVAKIIKGQLDAIDAILLSSEKGMGHNSMTVPLPVCFPEVRAGSEDTVRTIVYASVLRSLEKRGFKVALRAERTKMGGVRPHVLIEWMGKGGISSGVDEMKRYLESKMIRPGNRENDER